MRAKSKIIFDSARPSRPIANTAIPGAAAVTIAEPATPAPPARIVARRGQPSIARPISGAINPPSSVIDSATPIVDSDTPSPAAIVARNGEE